MSEVETDRADCPDCGKDVAVNRDGTLRKHTCVAPEVVTDTETRTVVDGDETRTELVTKPDVLVPAAEVKDRRLCAVPRCDRPALSWSRGLCGAHWALRRDLAERSGS